MFMGLAPPPSCVGRWWDCKRELLQINSSRPLEGNVAFQPFWFLCVDVIFPSVALLTSAPHTDQDPHREWCASEIVDCGRVVSKTAQVYSLHNGNCLTLGGAYSLKIGYYTQCCHGTLNSHVLHSKQPCD